MTTTALARTDTSIVGRWWWTVDKMTLGVLLVLIVSGAVLTLAAGRPAAARIQLDSLHFVKQQMAVIVVGLGVMVGTSLLSPRWVKRIGVLGLFLVFALLIDERPEEVTDFRRSVPAQVFLGLTRGHSRGPPSRLPAK